MSHDIYETRICVQKLHVHHEKQLHDIHKSDISHDHKQRLRAAFFTKKIWPKNSKIRIGFLGNGKQIPRSSLQDIQEHGSGKVDPLQTQEDRLSVQQMIRKIVRERIVPLVNLDIDFVDDVNKANVRISFDPDGGAWSLVGTDHLHQKTGATMNLGWFDVATTMHEFGHMLGMIHEHQNPKGEPIKWNDKKVFEWAKATQGWSEQTTETNIIKRYDISSINGSNFDPMSIMLYFFPASLTTNNIGTHQNLRLSGLDVEWITKTYPTDHGNTAEEFYQKVYNESLRSSIEQSEKEASQFGKGSPTINWKTIGIGVLFIIIVLLVVMVIWWFVVKMKRSGRHQGRFGSY